MRFTTKVISEQRLILYTGQRNFSKKIKALSSKTEANQGKFTLLRYFTNFEIQFHGV